METDQHLLVGAWQPSGFMLACKSSTATRHSLFSSYIVVIESELSLSRIVDSALDVSCKIFIR